VSVRSAQDNQETGRRGLARAYSSLAGDPVPWLLSAGKPAPTAHRGPGRRLESGSNWLIEKKFIRARPGA